MIVTCPEPTLDIESRAFNKSVGSFSSKQYNHENGLCRAFQTISSQQIRYLLLKNAMQSVRFISSAFSTEYGEMKMSRIYYHSAIGADVL